MEFFLELGFTIALSLICLFFLSKFLLADSATDVEDDSVSRSNEVDFEAECENLKWVSERRIKEFGIECVEKVFDESPERVKCCNIEQDDGKRGLVDDEEEWEGIERSELERDFESAVAYADQIVNLSNDVKMQLYGLHKIATQGHCHEPQPMAFNISLRPKWKAWQQLRNMSPEAAMEQYITILSKSIPGWTQRKSE